MKFVTEPQIVAIQADSIDTYGGSHGLRDRGLLLSALDRVENRFHYEPDSSVSRLAASLGWGLIKNHVFVDGNQRIGLAAVVVFLELNGHTFTCSEDEVKRAVLQVAASEIDETGWTAFLEKCTGSI